MDGEARYEEMLIYHVYVRDGVGTFIRVGNKPCVNLFRSNDGAINFFVLRVPISSKGTSSGVASDGILAFLAIQDGLDMPLNNIGRRALAVLIIQNTCKCLVLTT
jgi:hypothetical protein